MAQPIEVGAFSAEYDGVTKAYAHLPMEDYGEFIWTALKSVGEDPVAAHPTTGEAWQYMGTFLQGNDVWVHEFRHRTHPRDDARTMITVPVNPLLQAELTALWSKRVG